MLLLGAALVCAKPVAAAPDRPLDDGGDARRLMQDNSRRFDDLILQQKMRQMDGGRSPAAQTSPAMTGQDGCLPIRGVRLAGIALLSQDEVRAIGLPQGQCMELSDLNRFSRALTAKYVEKGYIAARVHAEGPDADGVLTLRVVEGRVAEVRSDDAGLRTANLFPGLIGQPLNVHDLDQGLDQANRLRSNRVTVDVLPGAAAGDSILQLHNLPQSRISGALSLDNTGRESTGRMQAGASLGIDNALGWSDFFNLSAQSTTENPAVRHSRSESLFFSLPYGYWTMSLMASRADYLNPLQLPSSSVQLSGNTSQTGMRLDRVLSRDQGQILSAELQLTQKRVRNYFQDVQLGISSPNLTVLEAGLSQMRVLPAGLLQWEAEVQRGTRWLGADAPDARQPGAPTPQFTKWKLGLNLYQTLALPGGPYQWQSSLNGQGSRNPLPGVEKLDPADASAVRGFRNNSLAGDTGWYWRNTLSRRWQFGGWTLAPRLGLDGGRVLQSDSREAWLDIAGATAGATFSMRGFTLDLDYSRPLYKPAAWPAEGHILLARFSWQW
ncbi:ShlB/FhaC/HecB family hemolysin secretion/activation protein [Chromobacterium sp. IIBBL 290-4]|uniref:ShlB/FhaC/HecB family hemolysin secretion/activation protein n=1 Tax=Chromobacterium sp. IIBBL 290-4 TaxID=2953890 RepID=UPI0020B76367|nr:ShlB/FhaC/HecB family hemolysin secretion/activation protein [Chromobacterium sp. IIBBL 290-4]UTH74166.1 ShlB/FhaC/HecB family hemolysin secretion/activation protein [Chromobacterium sp. IIBBL 290-4]